MVTDCWSLDAVDFMMANNSPKVKLANIEQEAENDDNDGIETETSSDSDAVSCSSDFGITRVKLNLPEHLAAYLEKRDLVREIDSVTCDNDLVQKVMCNYIVAKRILSYLSWQDKLVCKSVCSTWHSAINALRREQIGSIDFFVDLQRRVKISNKLKTSDNLYNEPMVVLTFSNMRGFSSSSACEDITPCACNPPCKKEHLLMDYLQHQLCGPKNCMLTVIGGYISYMPPPHLPTAMHTIIKHTLFSRSLPHFLTGVYIPVIPDVEFHVINIKHVNRNTIDVEKDFFSIIDKLAQTRIFKGALVYVTEKFLLHAVEDIVFLDYLKDIQPNVPYALGGCIIEETMTEQSDIEIMIDRFNQGQNFVSENFISIGLFSVPKNASETEECSDKCKFDMFSLVIESAEWTKLKIEQAIKEFAKKIPHFEHSVALKLSCVGRDQKHEVEQDYFRAAFPDTPLVGCYGNGELGLNHPARPAAALHPVAKRHKHDPGPKGIMYSYSTVFVYIGWGKVVATPTQPSGSKSTC